jgi:NAD(P)-dependent dehydrogenase (short-subunit alcohol dehydrogenase family)
MLIREPSVALVTGAASGMGREISILAAARGYQVIATDINAAGLIETQKAASEVSKESISVYELDVSSQEKIHEFASRILPDLNEKTLFLFNNAGMALFGGSFNDTPLVDFEWLLNVNLLGVVRMTKAFLPYCMSRNRGRIVNVSSVFGLAGVKQQSAYCTAKFGVRGFSESLRMELAPTNIRVTCVHPGGVRTNICRNARVAGQVATQEQKKQIAEFFDQTVHTTAQKAARLILNAAEKGKPRLLIGIDAMLIDRIVRTLPTMYSPLMSGRITKSFGD